MKDWIILERYIFGRKKLLEILKFLTVSPVFIFIFVFSSQISASPKSLTYQGRIVKEDGSGLEYNNVSFVFQITDPSGQCVIYQEQVNGINMANSGGVFDVAIGNGTIHYPLNPTPSVLDAFNNSSTFTCGSCSSVNGTYLCTAGSNTYAPVIDDIRKLRVTFYDGSGWKLISPDNTIRSVPFSAYAMSAQKLGTNIASDFLLKAGLPTCGAGTFLTWDGVTLTCAAVSGASGGTVTSVTSTNSYLSLTNGTSTPVLTVNVGTVAGTVAAGNDSRITGAFQSSTSLGGDLSGTLPNPAVSKINGVAVFTAVAGDDGKFLKYINGSGWQPQFIKLSELKNATGAASAFNVGACTAAQTLVWSSLTDQFTCQDITLPASNITGLATVATSGAYSDLTGVPTLNSLLPSQAGQNGKFLTTDGTNASWAASSSQWTTSGSNIYYNTGNVGIGTASPTALLHVNGTVSTSGKVSINSGASWDTQLATATLSGANLMALAGNSLWFADGAFGAYDTRIYRGAQDVLRTPGSMIVDGKVGIGTTNPGEMLTINTATTDATMGLRSSWGAAIFTLQSFSNYWQIMNDGYGKLVFYNSGTPTTPLVLESGAASNSLYVKTNGNVGVGTTTPNATLQVNGTITGKAAVSNASTTIDFSTGNLQYTADSCGAFQFNNLKDGGNYTFIVQGTTAATCSFTAFSDAGVTSLTVHLPPDHTATLAGKHTIYNVLVAGNHVYLAWTPGY